MNFTIDGDSSEATDVDYGQLSLQIINILLVVTTLLFFLATKIKTMILMCQEGKTATEKRIDGVNQTVTVNIGELKNAIHTLAAEVKAASSGKPSPSSSVSLAASLSSDSNL